MAIFNISDFTFDRDQIRDLSEALFESGFAKPEVSKFHSVVEGIITDKQLPIIGRLNGLLGAGNGECNPTAGVNQFGGVDKTWRPKTISDRLVQCVSDLENTFWAWVDAKKFPREDVTGTTFFNYVEELVSDLLVECIFRVVWFNDQDAEVIEEGGVITNGTPLAYFNKINGLWRQLFEIGVSDPSRITKGLDTKNNQASYVLQAFDSDDTTNKVVSNLLLDMRLGADMRLRGKQNLVYTVTQSVADQYERELTFYNVNFTTERLENGISLLRSGGIEVYGFDFWDRIISQYYNDGSKLFKPHRAVLADPTNILVGVESVSQLSTLNVFYDQYRKENVIDFSFRIDAKIGIDYEVQTAH
jgi:hypothetical protein